MIIKFNGTMDIEQLKNNIETVVSDVLYRAGIESKNIGIRDAQIGVVFNTDQEPQYLTVTHDDVPEVFQVHVKLNEHGEIERSADNEAQSFHDEYTKAITKGGDVPCTTEIPSTFNDEDLEELHTVDAGDLQEVHYKLKDSEDHVVRYYRSGVLVGEACYRANPEE